MKILRFTTLFGPNVYTEKPLVGMVLDLESYADRPSDTFPGFPERLAQRLPGLIEHRCTPGHRGGFLERLGRGTYMGHICEHVALELSDAAGFPQYFGRTVSTDTPHVYLVLGTYKTECAMRTLLEASVALVQAVIDDRPFDIDAVVAEAREEASHEALGPSTQCIVDAALARGIPVRRRKSALVQLGWGVNRRLIQAALTDRTPEIAVDIASDKSLTKELLREAYIPVPPGLEVRSEPELQSAFLELTPPLVIKPLDANQGKGVSLSVTTIEAARAAFQIAREHSRIVMVEEQFRGRDFRILVIGGRVVAASERLPANVVGDGHHTLRQLVDLANQDPRRGSDHDKALTQIVLDAVVLHCLERRGLGLDSVPVAGERILLRENANLSTGGEAHDVTPILHPSIAEICVRAARIVGLDIAGIDLMAQDVTRPLRDGEGIIEINAAPGLRMHVHPSHGEPVAAGEAIINFMFPPGANGRIPIVAITGTNGKTTTARLVAHAAAAAGRRVGMTSTDGIYIGGKSLGEADAAGPLSASAVLADSTVEVGVFETARGGMVRRGLAFDRCDVAVITNIRPDHIGQDGIRDLDDLIWIKSLIAERVREGGTLVINADDSGALAALERPRVKQVPKNVVLFSESPDNPAIRAHLAGAGFALYVRGEYIVEAYDSHERPLVRVRDLPITFNGALRYNVSNCMAAIAASLAIGVSEPTALAALQSFAPQDNPGRGNIFAVGRGYVMLDYGHNSDAFAAVGRLRVRRPGRRLIGVVAVPGDRSDEIIAAAGRVAAEVFDQIFIREDEDLRGRQPGETASLLCHAASTVRPGIACEFVREGEVQALWQAIEAMNDEDLAVVFYDRYTPMLNALFSFGARPVDPEAFVGDPLPDRAETREVVPLSTEF